MRAGLDFERARSRSVSGMAVSMTISEAAEASGLTAHTLRYYERAGLLDPVGREAGGRRRYSDGDLSRIAFLTKLRATGMPIREVRKYAELLRDGDGNEGERLALLEAHRDQVRAALAEMGRNLELIDYKIDLYKEKIG
jgi:DNA-binding transcriptional MerR regulator